MRTFNCGGKTSQKTDLSYANAKLMSLNKENKTWNAYTYCSCWIGMNVCIPAYQMASSAIAMGLSWSMALFLVTMGNIIVLIPLLLNADAGTRYGLSFPAQAKATFGLCGACFPIGLRTLIGAAWTGILIWMGAESLQVAMELIFPIWSTFKYGSLSCFLVFWFLNISISLKGAEAFKKLEGIGAPILGVLCISLFVWGVHRIQSMGYSIMEPLLCLQTVDGIDKKQMAIALLIANISYYSTWAVNASDLSRYATSPKAHNKGTAMGLPLSMMFIAFLGIYITGVTKLVFGSPMWDPNDIVRAIGNKWGGLIVAVAVLLATLTTNVTTNILPPANGIVGLFPKVLNYKGGVVITGIFAIVIRPWALVNDPSGYIFSWLNIYGLFTGSIASILICDYYVIKNKQIKTEDLCTKEASQYWYWKGFNVKAIAAWLLSTLPLAIGLFAGIKNTQNYGWIFSFVAGFVIYLALNTDVWREKICKL